MCGRVVSTWSAAQVASYFSATLNESLNDVDLGLRFNVAPTSPLYTVVAHHDAWQVNICHWGLVPRWAKNPANASKMINARSETLFERPSYRPLLSRHRCIVPVDGFYEWGPDRGPRYIYDAHATPLEFAGLWTTWRDADGHELNTCTVLTVQAAGAFAGVHHRMPVALDPEDRQFWLTPAPLDPVNLGDVLERAEARAQQRWALHEVSRAVNKVSVNGPQLIHPLGDGPAQGQLFDGV